MSASKNGFISSNSQLHTEPSLCAGRCIWSPLEASTPLVPLFTGPLRKCSSLESQVSEVGQGRYRATSTGPSMDGPCGLAARGIEG